MALLQRTRILSQERLDLPDFNNIEDFVCADFKAIHKHVWSSGNFVFSGFEATGMGTPTLSIALANSAGIFSADDGVMYIGAPSLAALTTTALTPSATNYIELIIEQDTGGADSRAFWDQTANGGAGGEFSQIIDTFIFNKASLAISTTSFTGDADKLPICEVDVDAGGVIIAGTGIRDAMNRFFRLGRPSDLTFEFPWSSRVEPSSTQFNGADKDIKTMKEWLDAVMSRIRETSGTTYWYENPGMSLTQMYRTLGLGTLAGCTNTARFAWDGTNFSITDASGTPAVTDELAALRLFDTSVDLLLTRQDGIDAIPVAEDEIVWVQLPDPLANTTYDGVGVTGLNYRVSARGSVPLDGTTYWLAYRKNGKLILRGLGELEAGEERQVNDETTTALLTWLGFDPETATSVPYSVLPNSTYFTNIFTTGDHLVEAISTNADNINLFGAILNTNVYVEKKTVIDGAPTPTSPEYTKNTPILGSTASELSTAGVIERVTVPFFVNQGSTLEDFSINLNKIGTPAGNYTISIVERDPANDLLPKEPQSNLYTSGPQPISSLSSGTNLLNFNTSSLALTGTEKYFIMVETDAAYKSSYSDTTLTVHEEQTVGTFFAESIDATTDYLAQSFTMPSNGSPNRATAKLLANGSPTGNLVMEIQTDSAGEPSGVVLATSDTFDVTALTISEADIEFTFSTPPALTSGVTYWIVLNSSGLTTIGGGDNIRWGRDLSDNLPGEERGSSTDGGSSWSTSTDDFIFSVYTESAITKIELMDCDNTTDQRGVYEGLGYNGASWLGALAGPAFFNMNLVQTEVVSYTIEYPLAKTIASTALAPTGQTRYGTRFKADNDSTASQLQIKLEKEGAPTGNYEVRIETDDGDGHPSGTSIYTSGPLPVSGLSVGSNTVPFALSSLTLSEGYYHIVVQKDATYDAGWSASDRILVEIDNSLKLLESTAGQTFDGATWSNDGSVMAYVIDAEIDNTAPVPTDNECIGPVSPGTIIKLPLDSRDGDLQEEYLVGNATLKVFLNGQLLCEGDDYDEVGTFDTLSEDIEIQIPLAVDDVLTFMIDVLGGFNVGASGGGGGDVIGGANVGTGAGESFKQKAAGILEFRNIKAGAGINVVTSGDDIIISLSGGTPEPYFRNDITGLTGTLLGVGSAYNIGTSKLAVYRNGVLMLNSTSAGFPVDRYQEATSTQVLVEVAPTAPEVMTFVNQSADPLYSNIFTGLTSTVIVVPAYVQGNDSLKVWRNGILMNTSGFGALVDQYTESTTTSITLGQTAVASDVFVVTAGPTPTDREDQTGVTGTILTLATAYSIGSKELLVYKNGILMLNTNTLGNPIDRYQESSSTTVTLDVAAVVTDVFTFYHK